MTGVDRAGGCWLGVLRRAPGRGSLIVAYRHGSYLILAILIVALLLAVSDRLRTRARPVPAAERPHPRQQGAAAG